MGVEFQICQMTIDLMDYDEDDFYDGVTTGVGAATALQDAGRPPSKTIDGEGE